MVDRGAGRSSPEPDHTHAARADAVRDTDDAGRRHPGVPAPGQASQIVSLQASAGNRAVGRWLAGRPAGAPPVGGPVVARIGEPGAPGLLVDDTVQPEPHQQRRYEFLAALRAAVAATVAQALAGTPWPAPPQSDIDLQLASYAGLGAAALEQAIRREVPSAAGATTAAGLIPPIAARVRAEVVADLSGGAAGTVTQLAQRASAVVAQVAGAAGGLLDGVRALLKRRGDGGDRTAAAASVAARLDAGQPLDAGLQSRMQGSLGGDLSAVRIHTDASAAGLADELDSRAFTVGTHVAFGAGEYAPGTPAGDGLLAHELAHVVQQGGPAGAQADGGGADAELETDADRAAAYTVGTMWGQPEHTAHLFDGAAPMARRGGIGISRCKRAPTPPPTLTHNLPDSATPLSAPGERILFSALYTTTRPEDFELLYVATGGATFDGPGGPATKTLPGTAVMEQPMLLPNPWPSGLAITVEFKIRRKSDAAIVATKTWTFGRKTFIPTGLLQFGNGGGADEVALPTGGGLAAVNFDYLLDPRPPSGWTGAAGGPYYENYTILERFEAGSTNLVPADFAPQFTANDPALASPAAIAAYFHEDAFHASFTVDHRDMIVDQHSGGSFRDRAAVLMRRLHTPKTIEYDHVQVYEAEPGRALARYTIRTRLYPDGRATIQKTPL